MDENKNVENRLALSNSQSESQNLGKEEKFLLKKEGKKIAEAENSYFDIGDYAVRTGYVNSYIDRLTITGNLSDDFRSAVVPFGIADWLCLATLPEGGWRGQFYPDRKQRLYAEYDPANALKMRKNNFRVECNPNLLDSEQLSFLFKVILPELDKIRISRIDLAFDFERNLSEFNFGKSMSGGMYWSKTGEVQTLYYGAPSSDYRCRLYDKKAERLAKGSETDKADYAAYDCLWRLEFELTGSGYIAKQVRQGFKVVKDTSIVKRNYDLQLDVPISTQEKIMVKALDRDKNLFATLSKNSKTKYRKLADMIVTVDLSDNLTELLRNMQICSDKPRKVDTVQFCKEILAGRNPLEK